MTDNVIDLIDGAILEYGDDAMRWNPTGPGFDAPLASMGTADTHGRVPYHRLNRDDQAALRTWVELHGCSPDDVPVDPLIEYDPTTREWRIEMYLRRDGRLFLGDDGEVARCIVRRASKAALLWRTAGGGS